MYQLVTGICNIGKKDTLFEVGNGTSDSNRKNAFEVLKDGGFNSYGASNINGSLTISGDSGVNNLSVNENLIVSGDSETNNLKVNGGFNSYGDATIDSNLKVRGSAVIDDYMSIGKPLEEAPAGAGNFPAYVYYKLRNFKEASYLWKSYLK